MTALAERDLTERRRRVRHVAELLDELEAQRRRIYRLQAGGASRAGVRDQKLDLAETRRRLIAAVRSRPAAFSSKRGSPSSGSPSQGARDAFTRPSPGR